MDINLYFNSEIWYAVNRKNSEILKTEVSYDEIEYWARKKGHNVIETIGLD